MQVAVPLACFLSVIRPPGVQFENALLQISPVDKSKCPFVRDTNDIGFQLFTRHNPTVYQELVVGDDEKLFASNFDFNDRTVLVFHAFMEQPDDGSSIMIREAYMQRGDTNVILVDAQRLEAGPWYFTAAQNTWYIGRFAAQFVDYMASRGLNLNNTHFVGHSLGAQSAGVAGSALQSGRVARITGLDPALPLFDGLPIEQRLDPSDAEFVDVVHTDAGIFGYKIPVGHIDFYPNGGQSPQPGCELEVVLPQQLLLNKSTGAPTSSTRSRCFAPGRSWVPSAFHTGATPAGTAPGRLPRTWDTGLTLSTESTTHGYNTFYLTSVNHHYTDELNIKHNKYVITDKRTDNVEVADRIQRDMKNLREKNAYSTIKRDNKQVSKTENNLHNEAESIINYKVTEQRNGFKTLRNIQITKPTTLQSNQIKKPKTDRSETEQEEINNQFNLVGRNSNEIQKEITPDPTNQISKYIYKYTTDSTTIPPQTYDKSPPMTKPKSIPQITRQKRSLPLQNSDNVIFKLLNFLIKNRKGVLPAISVIREITTLVKSSNGELSHFLKESYFGGSPVLSPISYTVEIGNESKIVALLKKFFGLSSRGDRLTITGS